MDGDGVRVNWVNNGITAPQAVRRAAAQRQGKVKEVRVLRHRRKAPVTGPRGRLRAAAETAP